MTNKQQWIQAVWVTGMIWLLLAMWLEVLRPGLIVQYGVPIMVVGMWLIVLLVLSPVFTPMPRVLVWLVPFGAGAILLTVGGVTVWTVVLILILLGVLFNFTHV